MTPPAQALRRESPSLDSAKFRDPLHTADGQARARIGLRALETLWFNTGTLCNLACGNCYIESSPANDRLSYLTAAEVGSYLDEIAQDGLPVRTVGLTGGEPFMNPEIAEILERILAAGHEALVLTNAMRPMMRHAGALRVLRDRFGARLTLRVSIDHYAEALHALERGPRAWAPMIHGLKFLSDNGFAVTAAGRTMWKESEAELRAGYARLFERENIRIDANDPAALLLFPEMDESLDVPEITEACWDILGVDPGSLMCASSRMVVKRKGESRPVVMPCTLLPYDERFVMGHALGEAAGAVALNHPHCARFCVLGGGSCSG
ncbi:MAG: radical SAM protein [Rhodospirillaceae bacterium]|nr:radical SAM protein [Rhodospirillaceae bacterium]MYJ72351.1 radical SAM protein [Rhodospirillaceae bacterium]